MTRNQKIALGCGGAGCLGLIFLVVVGAVVFFVMQRERRYARGDYSANYNFNVNSNSDSNSRSNSNSNDDRSSSSSSSSMSDDDKHKLYQAAGVTGDAELVRRVSIKIGLMSEDYTPSSDYESFVKDHFAWAVRNAEFIQSINSKEKAIAYVHAHIDD